MSYSRRSCIKFGVRGVFQFSFAWCFLSRVSKEQIDRIQERRTKIKGLLAELGESLRLVRELQRSSEVCEMRMTVKGVVAFAAFFSGKRSVKLLLRCDSH